VGVYLVWPASIALVAASLMFCGVSKSRFARAQIYDINAAAWRMASAACIAASVEDGFIWETFSDTAKVEIDLLFID